MQIHMCNFGRSAFMRDIFAAEAAPTGQNPDR